MHNTILHITNADLAVDIMKEAEIKGDFLPWRDVLHVVMCKMTANED